MAYPFPGMNPYLEHRDVWHDFHQRIVPRIGDSLASMIRPRYFVKVDENVYIHQLTPDERALLGRPDVAIAGGDSSASSRGGAATIEPLAEGLLLPVEDQIREPFLEIFDSETRELITVIELLSPTNKRPGADRDQYLAKRKLILAGTSHLVEIDLLRGGARPEIEGLPDCDYAVMVSRCEQRPRVGLWPVRLRERLPKIPIPLAGDDPDVSIDLQELLETQFEAAGYEDYVYKHTPQPPLHPDDLAWANDLRGIA